MGGLHPILALLRPLALAQHEVEVELQLPADLAAKGGTCFLPVWTPGSYLVRDHARLLDRLRMTGPDGIEVPLEKLDLHRWAFPKVEGGATLRYRLLCNELTVRTNHVDAEHAQLIGAATFVGFEGESERPWQLRFEGWPETWRLATALEGRGLERRAPDYDALVDAPLELGRFSLTRWTVAGTRFELAITGHHACPEAEIQAGFQRITEVMQGWFGDFPFRRYLFLLNFSPGARGGLEHRDSCSLLADPFTAREPEGRARLFELAAHEFFHAWSVKRLRPAELVPLDYGRGNPTPLLWFFEGFTSFAQLLICAQAGLLSPGQVLGELGRLWTEDARRAGRHEQSLASASRDAWIRAYKPNEFTANTTVDYYDRGCLAAWVLEGMLRQASLGDSGVQDLFRDLWVRFGDGPVTDADLREAVGRMGGFDPEAFWTAHVEGTAEFDPKPLEAALGLDCTRASSGRPWLGLSLSRTDCTVQNVIPGSPAFEASLGHGMEVVALDGWRTASPVEFHRVLAGLEPGQPVELLAASRGRLSRHRVCPRPDPEPIIRFKPRLDVTLAQDRAYRSVFGQSHPGSGMA